MSWTVLIGVVASILLLLVPSLPIFPLALGLSVPVICLGSFGPWGTFLFCVSRVSAFVYAVSSAVIRGCVALFVGLAHINAIAILIVGITDVVALPLSWGIF